MTEPGYDDMKRQHRNMKAALANIESFVTPGPDGYRAINPGDAELMHLLCCIGRGGTIAGGKIQPTGEDDDD